MNLSIEEFTQQQEEYIDGVNSLEEFLSLEKRVTDYIDGVITDMVISSNTVLTKDAIEISLESLENKSIEFLGESDVNKTTLTVEALDGERLSLVTKLIKRLQNYGSGFMDIMESLSATAGLLKDYDSGYLSTLKEKLKTKEITPLNQSIDASSIKTLNKKLGIYYEMNDKFNVKDFKEHLDITYNMVVKEDLFGETAKYCYDQLIVGQFSIIGEDKEEDIPELKSSLKFINKIKSKEIRNFIHKDTKVALLDRTLGTRFMVVSVYQDHKGADARSDYFKIPAAKYNKSLPALSEKELIELVDYAILCGDRFYNISKVATDGFWTQFWNDMRSQIMSSISGNLFSILAIKRLWRQYYMASEFYRGLISAMLKHNKSYKDIPHIVRTIVQKQTK